MFYDDLAIGKRGEELMKAAFLMRGHQVEDLSEIREYQKKDIDMRLTKGGVSITLEVKNDLRSNSTGNVFIETYNRNNISREYEGWLCYCEADYLCFVQEFWQKAHIVNREELIKHCWAGEYRKAKTAYSEGFIVPIGELKKLNTYHCIELGV